MMFPACSTRCRMAWSSSQLIRSVISENMKWTQLKNLEHKLFSEFYFWFLKVTFILHFDHITFLEVFIWSHSLICPLQCPTAMQWKGHSPVEEALRKSNKAQKASVTQLKWHRLKWGLPKKSCFIYFYCSYVAHWHHVSWKKTPSLFEVRNTDRST